MSKPNPRKRPMTQRTKQRTTRQDGGPLWLWGSHAVLAALSNPKRTIHRLVATPNAARRLAIDSSEILAAKEIDRLLPQGAVHQGIAARTDPLDTLELGTLIAQRPSRLVVLDQVADPHNLGAIYRSAAAFGFGGVIVQTRHTPDVTGVAAKSAAGGIEAVPECRVVNIARSLETLAEAGYTVIGLSGEASSSLANCCAPGDKTAIVLGAEGAGLRPAVAKACTSLARIPMSPAMESLNVSNAAAIAFYCISAHSYS
ncbi:MAG: RNA methyltransferase [Pseudomonadota bacterium]